MAQDKKQNKEKYTWHAGDTTMSVNGKQGKFVNGKFVSTSGKNDKKKK